MSEDLRIPKFPVTVELAAEGAEPRSAMVFVAEHKAYSYQRQRVLDLLEGEAPFLPVANVNGGGALVNKATLIWVAIPLSDGTLPVEEEGDGFAEGDQEDVLFDLAIDVQVELLQASSLHGELLYSLPPEHARVVDYLNQAGRFIRLWTPDRLYLVNKSYVLNVTELGDSN